MIKSAIATNVYNLIKNIRGNYKKLCSLQIKTILATNKFVKVTSLLETLNIQHILD